MIKLCITWTVVNCHVQSVKLFLCLFCFRKSGNSELQPWNPYLKVLNSRAVFSKSKTLSYDIHILAQTCIEQIQDTRGTCHKAENSEKFEWKVNVKVIFSEIPTKHSEHLRLRFEVVQSFRLVWTKQTVAYHLPFTAFKSCAFYIRAFFYNIQTVRFSGALKKCLTCHCLVVSTLGSVLLNTGFCLCFCKRTYVLQARAPESQPLSSVCVTLFHLKQVTNLKVSNIKRRLAYFQAFIGRWLPYGRSILRGVHVRKVTTSWVQF